jgi:hypothetical protein
MRRDADCHSPGMATRLVSRRATTRPSGSLAVLSALAGLAGPACSTQERAAPRREPGAEVQVMAPSPWTPGEEPDPEEVAEECACPYSADDPSATIISDDCAEADTCADATCVVDVNRDGTVTRDTLICDTVPPPPPPPETRPCVASNDCPEGHICHQGFCRKQCTQHSDCDYPDECFENIGLEKLCLHEGETRCSTYVHTSCSFYDDGKGDTRCFASGIRVQHESHGAPHHCGVTHQVDTCTVNADQTGCILETGTRTCFGDYFE